MIVSHKHRFIFLKVRKTAGTSIEIVLAKVAGDDAIVTPILEQGIGHEPRNHEPLEHLADRSPSYVAQLIREARVEPDRSRFIPYFNHMPAWLARSKLGDEIWDTYFKFCFERNPWEKVASMYGWYTRDLRTPPSFEDWLFSSHKVSSDSHIYSIEETCAVDAIGRYESLSEDFEAFLQRVGIDGGAPELPSLKSGFRREVHYVPKCVERIRQVFHREIEMFGYECPPALRV
jgi:Sulfotransferase family